MGTRRDLASSTSPLLHQEVRTTHPDEEPASIGDHLGPLKYYGPHTIFLPVALMAFHWRGLMVFAVPLIIFVLSPILELLTPPDLSTLPADSLKSRSERAGYDLSLVAAFVMQVTLVICFLTTITDPMATWERLGMILTMGVFCGALGINVAHELLHRRERAAKFMSRLLLSSTLYSHFYTEHIRGHHVRVATWDDPVTARHNETLYKFWWRSVSTGYRDAWKLDAAEVALSHGIQAVMWSVFAWGAGVSATLHLLPAALIGVLLLETINYIEHYGLQRGRRPDGRPERTTVAHSWTSNHPLSRWFMFELTRHADHHVHPARPFPLLKPTPEGPQLPSGYPGMMALALVPRLWFRVMNPRLTARVSHLLPVIYLIMGLSTAGEASAQELAVKEPKPLHLFVQLTGPMAHGVEQESPSDYALCGDVGGILCLTPGTVIGMDSELTRYRVSTFFQPLDSQGNPKPFLRSRDRKGHTNPWWQESSEVSVYLRVSAAGFADCAGLPAGYFHIGVGQSMAVGQSRKHTLSAEIGPAVYARQSWAAAGIGDDDGPFENARASESFMALMVSPGQAELFFPVAIGLEYMYQIRPGGRLQLHTTFVPLFFTNSLYFGLRYRM